MNLYERKEACCGCGACVDACPVGAVHMVMDEEGFWYSEADAKKCAGCKRCERVCPLKSQGRETGGNLYFGVQAKDTGVRYASSSGGMFPVLAEYVFRREGTVFGAAYDGSMRVAHREAGSRAELGPLKRTKYVQSSMEGIYRRIEALLKEDRWALFCGTPCQAHALKRFLDRPYPKLLTAALICYGAPSPGIWGNYVKYLERESGGKMTEFSFRDKRAKDNGHTCAYTVGGREYAGSLYGDLYCRMYFLNYIIRPSCHSCGFCTVDRDSDFTIGDFWGIEKVRPDVDDGMGTSVLILHTDKAKAVWEQIKGELDWFPCRKEDVLQPRLESPTEAAKNRKRFMRFYEQLPFPVFCSLFNRKLIG